jgi:hypothetical protein
MVPRCGVFVHGLDFHAALQQQLRIPGVREKTQPNNDGDTRTSCSATG